MKKRKTNKPHFKPGAGGSGESKVVEYEQNVERWIVCPDNNHIHKHLSVCYFTCSKFKKCKRIEALYVKYGFTLPLRKEKKCAKRRTKHVNSEGQPKARDEGGAAVPEQAGEISGHEDIS
jgi:hypothetical protein